MVTKFLKPCAHPSCQQLTENRYCDQHTQTERRLSANARGYNYRWQKYRKSFLAQHPLCRECEKQGKTVLATVVDHIIPHKGNKILFWDEHNHQPLCETCHNRKTAKYDM